MNSHEYIPGEEEQQGPVLPYAPEAEQSILGCILIAPAECMPKVRERFGSDEVFYDLKHKLVFESMCYVWSQKGVLDSITLYEELKSRGLSEQLGGLEFLMALESNVTSKENLPAWMDVVWEKYIARRLVEKNTQQIRFVQQFQGAAESFVAQVQAENVQWSKLLERGSISPRNLCEPNAFADAYYDAWFARKEETYGYPLPFKFPLRIRPSEMTLFTGDNGSGKSSMLGLISIVAAKEFKAGERIVIASMEVPPEITLWIMARQLLGVGHLECTEQNIAKITRAFAWINKRFLIYNFLGITDWRELLNTFRYARAHRNGVLFVVDSVMRIGIPDDDYALQGIVAAQFADFCVSTGAHTFLVIHENKGEGRAKDRVRGSKQWTDNAHNVVGMKRNESKAEKTEEWKAEFEAGDMSKEYYESKLREIEKQWDSKFILSKQRYPGSQQNASRWLYFHRDSLQFHEQPGQAPFDFTLT